MPKPRVIWVPQPPRHSGASPCPSLQPALPLVRCLYFVLSVGNFVTPDLLGGGKLQMAGNLIYDQFLTARDWPFGATLSAFLIAVMMILLFIQGWLSKRATGGLHMNRALKLHLGGTFAFLYLPILVLMVLSFNKAGLPTAWGGFSVEWYGKLFRKSEDSSLSPELCHCRHHRHGNRNSARHLARTRR